jgi:hypothetical protein
MCFVCLESLNEQPKHNAVRTVPGTLRRNSTQVR